MLFLVLWNKLGCNFMMMKKRGMVMPVTPPVLNLTGREGQMVLQKYSTRSTQSSRRHKNCINLELQQLQNHLLHTPNQSELGGWSLTEVHSLTPHSRRSSTPSQPLKVTEVSMSSGSSSASLTWSSTKSRCTCTSVHVSVSSTAASTAGSLKQEVPGTEGGVRTR